MQILPRIEKIEGHKMLRQLQGRVGLSSSLSVMDQALSCILLSMSMYATFGKYVYITKEKTWQEAQQYCQEFHTDLAPATNARDTGQLRQLVGNTSGYIWIGMERNPTNKDKWLWSGGGGVSTFFWAPGQPDNRPGEDFGLIQNYMWHDAPADQKIPFVCYNAVVKREMMTWYCRENHHNLASVTSETEMLLIQKELDKNVTTEQVWMGLRFLPECWLWVDGEPLSYEAWEQGGKPAIVDVKLKCGVLNTMQGMQRNNGADPPLVQVGPVAINTNNQEGSAPQAGPSMSEESNMNAGAIQIAWKAHDCGDRLNFICY